MNTECYVEIPVERVRDAIHLAYKLSRPQGLGVLQNFAAPLSELDVQAIIDRSPAVRMDYVNGRACKFNIRYFDKKAFVSPVWHDHSPLDLVELLTGLGIDDAKGKIAAANRAQDAENEQWERENRA